MVGLFPGWSKGAPGRGPLHSPGLWCGSRPSRHRIGVGKILLEDDDVPTALIPDPEEAPVRSADFALQELDPLDGSDEHLPQLVGSILPFDIEQNRHGLEVLFSPLLLFGIIVLLKRKALAPRQLEE